MKTALKQGGANALNYYSTTAGAYLGWSYFPNIVENATSYLDGIVVDWESMPGTSTRYAGMYDLGKTGTHEAGHWVNLYHTFQGGCNNWGDYVDDTPAQSVATFGCPEGSGHLLRARCRPDPQLHGLLVRLLLRPVHGRPGRPHAGRLAALARTVGALRPDDANGPAQAGPFRFRRWTGRMPRR